MPVVELQSRIEAAPAAVLAWHLAPEAPARLVPPWLPARRLGWEPAGDTRGRLVLGLGPGPFPVRWVLDWEADPAAGTLRVEERAGPFVRWVFSSRVSPAGAGAQLEDRVEYELPRATRPIWGWLEALHRRVLQAHHARVARDLRRHATWRGLPWRVAVTGASGLVGRRLLPFLLGGGHRVHPLVRRPPRPGSAEIAWSPEAGTLDTDALEGVDAVVHLAGASVAGRWSARRKASIRQSRVDGTARLAGALVRLARPPAVLVAASAVGFYGDRGEAWLDETSPPGQGFLADVARDWEAATEAAAPAGIRVVRLRIGLVLAASGGALGRMLLPFRLGLGGPLGSGRQYVSWIGLDDLVAVIHRALADPELTGPVNAVSPTPVTQREFAQVLGRVLGRPARVPLPATAVRLLWGEMGEALLLASARVRPARLEAIGFRFDHPELEGALRWELGLGP